jgi:hypothetical protein
VKATFLAPALGPEGTFYRLFSDIMATAAAQLDVDLDLVDCRKSAAEMIDRGRALAHAARRPDYALLPNHMGVASLLDAARGAGRVPGGDVLLGGIDLGREALTQVAEGSLAVSIGSHFLDGAQALILLHDHHESRDFEPWSRRRAKAGAYRSSLSPGRTPVCSTRADRRASGSSPSTSRIVGET